MRHSEEMQIDDYKNSQKLAALDNTERTQTITTTSTTSTTMTTITPAIIISTTSGPQLFKKPNVSFFFFFLIFDVKK